MTVQEKQVMPEICVDEKQRTLASSFDPPYRGSMGKPFRTELQSLKNLISETELILSTTTLPEGRTPRALELLRAASALTDDLLTQTTNPAVLMGHKGGSTTAKRGSDYFRQLAARRKTHGGGRPPKS